MKNYTQNPKHKLKLIVSKSLFLISLLFISYSSHAVEWTITSTNGTTEFCCDKEYEFTLTKTSEGCNCDDDLTSTNITVNGGTTQSISKTSDEIYSFKVKFNCVEGRVFNSATITITCNVTTYNNEEPPEPTTSVCTVLYHTNNKIIPPLILENKDFGIDCNRTSAFNLNVPIKSGLVNQYSYVITYTGDFTGSGTLNVGSETISVTPPDGTSGGTVTFVAHDPNGCQTDKTGIVTIKRNKPAQPGIPVPENHDPNCPDRIWCFNSTNNSFDFNVPTVEGGVEYEVTTDCGTAITITHPSSTINKFHIVIDPALATLTCNICVRARNICNLWSDIICYPITFTSESPGATTFTLEDPNKAWWICCPTFELPRGTFTIPINNCTVETKIIGPDGQTLETSTGTNSFMGSFGDYTANNNQSYYTNYCNPFVTATFTVQVTLTNCIGTRTSSIGFTTLPGSDSRCGNQQNKRNPIGNKSENVGEFRFNEEGDNITFQYNYFEATEIEIFTIDGKSLGKSNSSIIKFRKPYNYTGYLVAVIKGDNTIISKKLFIR
ncbi:MAG: hypothetical protein Q8M15_02035 [Bacteroidota bacterium]|nr:hypothetical protein [Bacteroidota bacterium]